MNSCFSLTKGGNIYCKDLGTDVRENLMMSSKKKENLQKKGKKEKGEIAEPKERVKLVLAPRTKPVKSAPSPSDACSSNSVFGGAKPVDTAAREKEIEERLNRENGAIPNRSKQKVCKSGRPIIDDYTKLLSRGSDRERDHLVPHCETPILKQQHDDELQQQCSTLNKAGQKRGNSSSHRKAKSKAKKKRLNSTTNLPSSISKDANSQSTTPVKPVPPLHPGMPEHMSDDSPLLHDPQSTVSAMNSSPVKEPNKSKKKKAKKPSSIEVQSNRNVSPNHQDHKTVQEMGVTANDESSVDTHMNPGPLYPGVPHYDPRWKKSMFSRLLKIISDHKHQFEKLDSKKKNILEKEKSLTDQGNKLWEKIADKMKLVFPLDYSGSTCIKKFARLKIRYGMMKLVSLEYQKILFSEQRKSITGKEKKLWKAIASDMKKVFPSFDCSASVCCEKFLQLKTVYEMMTSGDADIFDNNCFNALEKVFGQ